MRRKPRTAAQLVPLRESFIRQLSVQQHCAVAAFRDGNGSIKQIPILTRLVYLPFLMARAEHGRKADATPYRAAETMLQRCYLRGQAGQGWRLEADEATHFAGLLVRFDAQLAACRSHVYDEAVAAMMRAEHDRRSPLADSDAPPADSAFFVSLVARAQSASGMNQAA
ncbi:hypothetical protein [Paraburkholderia adhaesiva]|uniref:hypothetical protein n=1 Tax=Paraburkholderia adhaesiva TaxID=2883244 RepID=UPI001F1AF250|nr:hypothetical protein [Paraburkholderia adhaesiva]